MWQRRTVNPSDERSPACKVWRSGSLNSRTNKGFIPQRDATGPPAKQGPLKLHWEGHTAARAAPGWKVR